MKRYWTLFGLMLGFFLAIFAIVEALGVPLLTDPEPWMNEGGPAAAALGIGLLIGDIVLPVPSSFVMIAHGALFGVVVGTALSLVGSVGAALIGFAIGRRGGPLLDRVVPAEERARADAMLERWGPLAILVTRPVPLLAETVAVMAGASRLRWGPVAVAAVAGSIPAALLYAITGATAASLDNAILMFGLVLAIATVFWFAGNRVLRT